jgi:hypothetical protein
MKFTSPEVPDELKMAVLQVSGSSGDCKTINLKLSGSSESRKIVSGSLSEFSGAGQANKFKAMFNQYFINQQIQTNYGNFKNRFFTLT